MENKIVVYIEKGGHREQAESFAERIGVPLVDKPGEQLSILFDEKGVSLLGYGMRYQGDFSQMLRRVTNGRLQHEMLVRASRSAEKGLRAIDATAGMGEDSFLLAAYGYEVTMYEQNPVIALLLKDAIHRAGKNVLLQDIVNRMQLIEGNSMEHLSGQEGGVSLIYLDPMFPERQKSGLIHKKLQLIQKLEAPCSEETALFDAAIRVKPAKIIVKRPLKGDYLAGRVPNHTLKGKAIRYDCYV